MNNAGPQEGDHVRAKGGALVMVVECTALGPNASFEGIQDAVLCTWQDETGDREEVYPPSSLVVVRRAAERS